MLLILGYRRIVDKRLEMLELYVQNDRESLMIYQLILHVDLLSSLHQLDDGQQTE